MTVNQKLIHHERIQDTCVWPYGTGATLFPRTNRHCRLPEDEEMDPAVSRTSATPVRFRLSTGTSLLYTAGSAGDCGCFGRALIEQCFT